MDRLGCAVRIRIGYFVTIIIVILLIRLRVAFQRWHFLCSRLRSI
jgi:hypothetical protein